MQETIRAGGQAYPLTIGCRDNGAVRPAFNRLTRQIFGFDFSRWHDDGYWDERYIPYTLTDGTEAVANVSASMMDFSVAGENRRYVQLGTVMTAPAYRGRGLARALTERVLEEWRGKCDLIYLYANDGARGFYPRFGFTPAREFVYTKALIAAPSPASRRLRMDRPEDAARLFRAASQSAAQARLAVRGNAGLVLFHCRYFWGDAVYELTDGTVAVAEQDGDTLLLHDVFAPRPVNPAAVAAALCGSKTARARLGFTPLCPEPFDAAPLEAADSTLFVLPAPSPTETLRGQFPVLSHA